MRIDGMSGTFENRGLLDGLGDIGFEIPGFIKEYGKAGAGAILEKGATKLGAGGAQPRPPRPKGGGAAAAADDGGGMSTGAKVGLGIAALAGIGYLVTRKRK